MENKTISIKATGQESISGSAQAGANITMDKITMNETITGSATASIMYRLIMEYPKEKEYLQFPGDFRKIPEQMRKLLDGTDIEDITLIRRASHGLSPDFVVTGTEKTNHTYIPPKGEQPGIDHGEITVYVTNTPTKEQRERAWTERLNFEKEWGVYPTETIFSLIKSKIFTITNRGEKINPALYASSKDIAKYLQPIQDEIRKALGILDWDSEINDDEPTEKKMTEREKTFLLINETVRTFNPYIHTLKKEPEFITRPIEELANIILDYFMEKTNCKNDFIREDRTNNILNPDILRNNFRFFFPCSKNDLQDFLKYAREQLGAAPIPGRRTVYPEKYLAETDKGAAKVFDGSLYALKPGQEGIIELAKFKSKKQINRFIRIDSDQIPPEIFKRKLSSFDWLIHDAINSIYQAGNEYMTIGTIANVINGNPGDNYNPSPKTRKEIEDSIKALIHTPIIMNFSQEAQAYKAGFTKGKNYEYWGNVIHGEIVTEKINGQITEGVLHILREPILFSLARKKEQIATIPIKILNSPTYMTKGAFELRDYLIRRIERMRPGKDKKTKELKYRTILLSSMYEAVGATNKRSNEKQRLFEKAIEFLDDWKKKSYFHDYAVDNDRIYIAESLPQGKEIRDIQSKSFHKLLSKNGKN